jgi:DNA repair photolyase
VFVRWQGQIAEVEDSRRLPGMGKLLRSRSFDAPEAMGVRFHEVEARSALNKVPGNRLPFSWTINPYRGCSHGCTFCFARPSHKFLELSPATDFDREIVVKVNVPERLRAELARSSWTGELIALGTNTDPYQWVEGRYRLTRGIWEAMVEARNPASVLTRSPLILRDLDLLVRLHEVAGFQASMSIPTLDERAWRATEPRAPHPRKRIEALSEIAAAGIPTGVLVAPLLPGINDSPARVERILELCAEAGVGSVTGIGLHLKGEVRGIFLEWLRSWRPDLLPHYERLYARGAFLPAAERARLAELVADGRRKAGLRERRGGAMRGRSVPRARPGESRSAPEPAQPRLFDG